MIITKIMGGLGNQMFQYAAGRSLALRTNQSLNLDLRIYRDHIKLDAMRDYELDIFAIAAKEASLEEINSFTKSPSLLQRISGKKLPAGLVFRETNMRYNSRFKEISGDTYLDGYWQTEYYFKDYADAIRQDFSFQPKPNKQNQALLTAIQADTSISLHVRRGDYVTNLAANTVHGICDIEYYQQAVEHMAKAVTNPHYFIFSDDPTWCTENLQLDHPTTYISHNTGAQSFEDMRLMSSCRHHIIANSSFSWWGAWLNPNPNKIVIAPKRWFRDPDKNSADIVPMTWILL